MDQENHPEEPLVDEKDPNFQIVSDYPDDNQDDSSDGIILGEGPNYREGNWRWVGLGLIVLTEIGVFMVCGIPPSIQNHIVKDFNINDFLFSLNNAVVFIPPLLFSVISGILVDKYGPRRCALIFFFLSFSGQLICLLSVIIKNYPLMIFGRFIFGFGPENMWIILTIFITLWFDEKERSFVISCHSTGNRVGLLVASFVCPRLYPIGNTLITPFLVSTIVMMISGACLSIFIYLDKKSDQGRPSFLQFQEKEAMKISDLKHFAREYWFLVLYGVLFYSTVYGFNMFQNALVMALYSLPTIPAASAVSCYYLTNIIFTPLCGMIMSRVKAFNYNLPIIGFFSVLSMLLFIYESGPNVGFFMLIAPLFLFGILYAIFTASFWATVAKVAPAGMKGAAFGFLSASYSVMMIMSPMIGGEILDISSKAGEDPRNSYINVCKFFLYCSIGTLTAGTLFVLSYLQRKEMFENTSDEEEEIRTIIKLSFQSGHQESEKKKNPKVQDLNINNTLNE